MLHAAGLWLLLPHGAGRKAIGLADPPLIEIEMVNEPERQKGQPSPGPTAPPPAPPAEAAPDPRPQSPPEPERLTEPDGVLPPPPSPQAPQAQPTPPAPPGRSAAAAVNLGNSDEDQEALSVTGDNVVPPRPDAVFRNKPPVYPAAAARRGREGVVHIRARVGTGGVPETVQVVGSSGDASLDRAARDAVELWRFEPARNNGVPVPFDYEVSIAFTKGGRGQ